MYTVDIDVGGTLTDGLFSDGKTAIPVKVDTTPHDLTVCFRDCLTEGARRFGFDDLTEFLNQVDLIRWSTTITTNALAQRTGPKLGLLVSKGHEHDLYTQSGSSPALGTLITPATVIGLSRPIEPKTVLLAVKTLPAMGETFPDVSGWMRAKQCALVMTDGEIPYQLEIQKPQQHVVAMRSLLESWLSMCRARRNA